MNDWLNHSDYASAPLSVPTLVLGALLAFLIGQTIAWVYVLTHTGLSYSRSFVNSLVVIPIIVSLVMTVMANNLVTAFGMMAVFAIVRFRNILRDTFDSTYILWSLAMGMACGTQRFPVAIVGCLLTGTVILYLRVTSFGTRHRYDTIINMHWSRPLSDLEDLRNLFQRHSRKALCASQRSHEGYEGTDLSYRLLMRDPERMDDLLTELRAMQGVSRVTGLKTEEESEL
jgi:hypothetical protein